MAIPIRKTLFVGLGGFGKATLRVIRRRFYEQFGFYQIPAIEYLVLDTDNDPKAMGYNSTRDSIDRQVAFEISGRDNIGEFIDLSCKRTALDRIYKGSVKPELRNALSWFDGRLREMGTNVLENGASMVRSFGKLGFLLTLFDSNRTMSETIQRKLKRLHNLTRHDKIWEDVRHKFTLDDNYTKIDIFVFCSTSGGTGSGIFLDMAYYLLGLFQNRKIDPTAEKGNMTLYAFLPHIILNDQRTQATFKPPQVLSTNGVTPQILVKSGTYAALTELERYQLSRSGTFSFDGGWQGTDFFIPDWAPYKNPRSPKKQPNTDYVGKNPFDWVFLIGDRSTSGHPLKGAEDAIEMAADKMFLFLIEKEQGKLVETYQANRPMFSMPIHQKDEDGNYLREYAKTYGGFGLSKIYIGEPLIHRWAGYYLAEKFLSGLLNTSDKLETQVHAKAIDIMKEFTWNSEKMFYELADNMLTEIKNAFLNLNTKNEFLDLVKMGTFPKTEKACYGKVNELDDIGERMIKKIKDKNQLNQFEKIIEDWLIENGITPTIQLLNAIEKIIQNENKIVVSNSIEKITRVEQFSEPCWRWILSHSQQLSWMGPSNQPKEIGDKYPYQSLLTVIDHYNEALDLPDKLKRRIIHTLEKRFFDRFIHKDCCESWRASLLQKTSELQNCVADLETGFVLTFKNVLRKMSTIQKELLQLIDEMKKLISVKQTTASHGTLERSIRDLLSREQGGHMIGITQELIDLSQGRDPKSRNVFCGEQYQKPESLKEPNPKSSFMAETFKEGFGTYQKEGVFSPINRLWDIVNIPTLDVGTKQWINILVDRNATALKVKPTLKDYYDSLKNNKTTQFSEDITHCIETCASYLRYESKSYGDSIETNSNRLVFAPNNILKDVKDAIHKDNQSIEVNQYGGDDLIFLTIEDGVVMPMLEMMEDYQEAYKDFDWPKAVWTRGGNPQEIFSAMEDTEVESEIYLGVILGNIWFDKTVRSYKMVLERVGLEGADQNAPLGSSIRELKEFFYGPKSENYIHPFNRLTDANEKSMSDIFVLRKLEPLLQYYEKFYFKEAKEDSENRQPPHYQLINDYRKLRETRLRETLTDNQFKAINNEASILNRWLHAFCEIVPIMETADLQNPNRDWLPVLMKEFSPKVSRETLIWHNRTFSPAKEQKHSEVKPYMEYVMDANLGDNARASEIHPWDEKNPEKIPPEIFELAWKKDSNDLPLEANEDSDDGPAIDLSDEES